MAKSKEVLKWHVTFTCQVEYTYLVEASDKEAAIRDALACGTTIDECVLSSKLEHVERAEP